MELTALLDALGAKMGLDGLGLDEEGRCSLLFDEVHEVTFALNPDDRAILLFGEVGAFDPHDPACGLRLLSASLLGAETGGAALSVDRARDRIILWKRHDDNLPDLTALEQAINDFLRQVIAWKGRLAESPDQVDPPTTRPLDESFGFRV